MVISLTVEQAYTYLRTGMKSIYYYNLYTHNFFTDKHAHVLPAFVSVCCTCKNVHFVYLYMCERVFICVCVCVGVYL